MKRIGPPERLLDFNTEAKSRKQSHAYGFSERYRERNSHVARSLISEVANEHIKPVNQAQGPAIGKRKLNKTAQMV